MNCQAFFNVDPEAIIRRDRLLSHVDLLYMRPKKRNCLFPVKNRVGRSVKKKFVLFFWSKMCVLCMFFVDWELGGR